MNNAMLRVGHVAEASGVSVDTVRHYERLGLIPKARRTESGYRQYPPETVNRVALIRRGLRFGFTLRELAVFLRSRDAGTPPCRAVRIAAEELLGRVEQQLRELQRTRRTMRKTLSDWDRRLTGTAADAPARLLEALPVIVVPRSSSPKGKAPRRRAALSGAHPAFRS